MPRRDDAVNPGSQVADLRQFTNWWWRAGQPYAPPSRPYRMADSSHSFVLYRCGPFQVEQVTLLPGVWVPEHCHPNVRTYECHIVGGGIAELQHGDGWRKVPYWPDQRHHVKYRRLLIEAGQMHRGVAHVVNVALSFQHWLNGVRPTFIGDDWLQPDGNVWQGILRHGDA